jgi:nucleoside-diphosphate-sugar epimerase
MTLLVTGATGHVGGEIVRQAVKRGTRVIAIARDEVSEAEAKAFPTVKWLQCDLADTDAVLALAQRNRIDACIHAAAISNEAYARPDPRGAIATNVGATANLLEAARLASWRRFVLISTGSVFSLNSDTTRPILEDQAPGVANVYSTTKLCAELLTRMYRTEYGLSAATVRISWVFGPPIISDQPMRGPIPSYLLRALQGIAIRESGADFAASFTYVADAAEGLLAAASAPELRHPTYHLGHGVNFTAEQAAAAVRSAVPDAVIELTGGTEPWTRYTSLRGPLAGDRLRTDTGYSPTHTLAAGVRAYADWMRAHPGLWRAGETRVG